MDLDLDLDVMSVGDGDSNKEKASPYSYSIFSEFRRTGQFSDVYILVEGKSYFVHKTVLSGCSPYFRALFTSWSVGSDCQEVTIPGVSSDIMEIILDFAYHEEIDINVENIERLLPAADQFAVEGLVNLCINFLVDQICDGNCIGILQFAREYFISKLEKIVKKYLVKNFVNVYSVSEEYLKLSLEDVRSLLCSDELNVKNEELVFDAILKWINHRPLQRRTEMDKLLPTVRFGLLDLRYVIEKIQPHEYVKENRKCKLPLIAALKYLHEVDIDEVRYTDRRNPLAKPRLPHQILFVIGGMNGSRAATSMEIYDVRADRWTIKDMLERQEMREFVIFANHGLACSGTDVFIVGGCDGQQYFNLVRKFDLLTMEWTKVSPMYSKRCYVSTVALNGYIYAMGGYDGHNRMNTAERFCPRTNQWTMIWPMHQQRSDAGAAVCNGKIYICGGSSGHESLNTAEVFDPLSRKWTMIAPMHNRRSGLAVVAFKGCVYALGGFNGATRLHTGEKYDPETDVWTSIPDMAVPRSNFCAQVIDGMIFAIGGFNGICSVKAVECYDATIEEWYCATDMNLVRCSMCACVVDDLPDVREYVMKYIRHNDPKPSGKAANEQTSEEVGGGQGEPDE